MHQRDYWDHERGARSAGYNSQRLSGASSLHHDAHPRPLHQVDGIPGTDYPRAPSQAMSVASSTGSWKDYERPINDRDLSYIHGLGRSSVLQPNSAIVPSSVASENYISLNDPEENTSRSSVSRASPLIGARSGWASPPISHRAVSPSVSSFSRPPSPSADSPVFPSSRQSSPPSSFTPDPQQHPTLSLLMNKVAQEHLSGPTVSSSQPPVLLKLLNFLCTIPNHSLDHAVRGMELVVDWYHDEFLFLRRLALERGEYGARSSSSHTHVTSPQSTPISNQSNPPPTPTLQLVNLTISKLEELSSQLTIRPPERPADYPHSVLWFREDAYAANCYHAGNKSHLLPKKILRNKDGTSLSTLMFDAMERSSERIANVLYSSFSPIAPHHKGRGKVYYSRFFTKAYSGAIVAIEIICPEAAYCADHYKAESVLQNALDTIRSRDPNRHLELPPTCPYVMPTNLHPSVTRSSSGSSADKVQQRNRLKATSRERQPPTSPRRVPSTTDSHTQAPTAIRSQRPLPPAPKSPYAHNRIAAPIPPSQLLSTPARQSPRHAVASPSRQTPRRASKRTNSELASTPSPARIQAKRLRQPDPVNELEHHNDEDMAEPEPALTNMPQDNNNSAAQTQAAEDADRPTTANATQPTPNVPDSHTSEPLSQPLEIEWITVPSNFSGLHAYIIQTQAKKNNIPPDLLVAALEIVTVFGRTPLFQRTDPSQLVTEFLARLTATRPTDVDEDNTNESWGHYQFTSGTLNIDTVIKSWSDVGSVDIAFELLSASLRICDCARFICYKNGVRLNPPDKRLLADDYLEKLMSKLVSVWLAAGGATEGFTARFLSSTRLEQASQDMRVIAPASSNMAVAAPNSNEQGEPSEPSDSPATPPTDWQAMLKAARLPYLRSLCVSHRIPGYKSSQKKDEVIEKMLRVPADARDQLKEELKVHLDSLPPPKTKSRKA